jgi:hypothetical protein
MSSPTGDMTSLRLDSGVYTAASDESLYALVDKLKADLKKRKFNRTLWAKLLYADDSKTAFSAFDRFLGLRMMVWDHQRRPNVKDLSKAVLYTVDNTSTSLSSSRPSCDSISTQRISRAAYR